MGIWSCFSDPSSGPASGAGESLLPGKQPKCIFCSVTRENGFDIVYEDDELIAFRDRWPRAKEHLLIIPRQHVISVVPELKAKDIGMLSRMADRGRLLGGKTAKLGFHIPPFSSVHHLHLHVLVPPFTRMGKLQYPVRTGRDGGKKWSWFVTPEQAISILESGGTIGLGARKVRRS